MTSGALDGLKYHARVAAGACLHATGMYRKLLPLFQPKPNEPLRRLQSYLQHYYDQAPSAEGTLHLDALGVTVACDIKDHMLWHHLEGVAPIYEQAEIEHCRKLARPGDHIVDIGANHGFWGFAVARSAGKGAVVYLCEANPTVLRRLRRTASMNPSIDARILPYAVTDGTQRDVTFYLPRGNLSGLGSTVLHDSAKRNGYLEEAHRITVEAKSIDELVRMGRIERMDLVKIDVEQAEQAVLRGAHESLARFKPRLVMIETGANSEAQRMVAALDYGTPYRLDEAGQPVAVEPDWWGNIFFERKGP